MTGKRQGQGESKASARRITGAERQREALLLRKQGEDYETIAKAVGYSGRAAAYNAIMSALQKMLKEPAEQVRALELSRLDAMLGAIWSKVLQGDNISIATALRICERRARLLGLDAPVTVSLEPLIRAAAMAEGLDPDEAVKEAETLLHEAQS